MNSSKFCFTLLLMLISLFNCVPVFASPWNELEPGTLVKLNRTLDLGEGIVLTQNSKLAVNHREFMSPPAIETLTLRLYPCTEPLASRKVPMLILEDLYGIEMGQGCQISMYLELRDYFKESYFELDSQ